MNLTSGVSVGALLLGLVLAPFFSASAQEAFVGTWVLDPAASTVPSTVPPGAAPTAGTLGIGVAMGLGAAAGVTQLMASLL